MPADKRALHRAGEQRRGGEARPETPRRRWVVVARRAAVALLVMGGVALLSLAAAIFLGEDDPTSSKLEKGQFCTVFDFEAPSVFAPTLCYTLDLEAQRSASGGAGTKPIPETVDFDTLIMVDLDLGRPSILRGGPGRRDVDGRMVGVTYISGHLTGRKGTIARYKLKPLAVR